MRLQVPASGDAWKPYHFVAAGSGDATLVKATPAALGIVTIYNDTAGGIWVKFYDSSTAPTAGGGTPAMTVGVPTKQTVNLADDIGFAFSSGLGFTIVGGAKDTYATGVAANSVTLSLGYAVGPL